MHAFTRRDGNGFLLLGTVKNDLPLVFSEFLKRHIRADAELGHDLRLHIESELIPGSDSTVVDGFGWIRYEASFINLSGDAGPRAFWARALRVEGQFLGSRRVAVVATPCTCDGLFERDLDGGCSIGTTVWTLMLGQPREEQTHNVKYLGCRTKCGTHPGSPRPLS